MVDRRTIELIHLAVDGEATPGEKSELREVLAGSEEARGLYREVEDLVEQLDTAAAFDPPAQLMEEVLANLRTFPAAVPFVPGHAWWAAKSQRDTRSELPLRRRRRQWLTAAWAAAAIVVVCLALAPLLTTRMARVETWGAAGSLGPLDTRSWPEVGRFESVDSGAALVVRRRGNRIAVVPRLEGAAGRPVTIRWERERLGLLEFLSEVRNDAPYKDKGEVTFSAAAVSPVLVLEKRGVGRGDVQVVLLFGNREVVTAGISID